MQIVIELSDEIYRNIKEENSIYGINNGLSARITGKVVGAIQNGTSLPKGHGRLIDADKLELDYDWSEYETDTGQIIINGYEAYSSTQIEAAPTIIEADVTERW